MELCAYYCFSNDDFMHGTLPLAADRFAVESQSPHPTAPSAGSEGLQAGPESMARNPNRETFNGIPWILRKPPETFLNTKFMKEMSLGDGRVLLCATLDARRRRRNWN
jgi:hypothetical protein